MTRVLVIEDDPQIRRFLRLALDGEGCTVQEASRLDVGVAASRLGPDLVLLDLGLPDGDGLAFIAPFRKTSRAPVIVLSARGQETDKVAALDAGADDYLVKPFGMAELLARVRAQLRRRASEGAAEATAFRFGEVTVDLAKREVRRAGTQLHLSPIEFRLLEYLLAHAGRVLTHRQILREVWGPGHAESGPTLRVYVGKLRHKLEADPAQPRHLLTEIGVGYRMEI
ncbi:MAG: response regulator [Thiobacillus sp.]|nr:response regulator [Thiobacillus sp.]